MFLMIWNLSGNLPRIGLTLSATGLYFFSVGFFAVFMTAAYMGAILTLPDTTDMSIKTGTEGSQDGTLDIWVVNKSASLEAEMEQLGICLSVVGMRELWGSEFVASEGEEDDLDTDLAGSDWKVK